MYSLPDERGWNLARLELFHPERPNPDAALRELVDYATSNKEHRALDSLLNPETYHSAQYVYFILLRVAQACEKGGRSVDARWVLDFAHDRLPRLFEGRAAFAEFSNELVRSADTTVPELRPRKATAREILNGVRVDEDGYVAEDKDQMEFWRQQWKLRAPAREDRFRSRV